MSGWCGYISLAGKRPLRLTKIEYYPVVHHPITEYDTVQKCLQLAEEAKHKLVKKFDLGVCMRAYPLIWNDPDRYAKHILLIGIFHLICAYFHMIRKKMDSSGLTDVMMEARLMGSGTVHGVLQM